MRRRFLSLIFLIFISSGVAEEAGEDYYNLGKKEYFKGNFDLAIEYLTLACQREPSNVDYLYLLAKSYQRQEKLKEAKDILHHCLTIDPKDKRVLLLLGDITFSQGAYEEAEYSYRQFLTLEKNPEVLFALGKIYLFTGRVSEAISMLQEASKVHPEDLAQVMFYLGQAYLEKKEYNHAYTAFTAAIKEASYRAEYYYWRGNAAFAARDYRAGEDALWTSHQDYQRALEYGLYKPEVYFMYGNSLLNRAFYYMATNRSKEAYNLLKSAESKYKETIKLDPTASNAYNNLSLAYYYMNNLDKAKEALKKAIELEPLVPFFHDNLGDIYYKEAKFKEAIKEWELTLELNPDYVAPNAGLLPIPPKSPKEKIKEAKRRLS